MTTISDMRKLAAPLLARHADLVMIGRTLVVRPVTHILRTIDLDRSLGKDSFTPYWGVTYLFRIRSSMSLPWFKRLLPLENTPWSMTNPNTQAALIQKIEEEALPQLRAIQTLQDFLEFTCTSTTSYGPWYGGWLARSVIQVALGDLDACSSTCAEFKDTRKLPSNPGMRHEFSLIIETLCPLVADGDRAGIARLLHCWEETTVKNWKLEKLWQPSPFPIELQAPETGPVTGA